MRNRLLITTISALWISVSTAQSADLSPNPTSKWGGGLFAGLNFGYGFGDTDITRAPGPPGPPGINTNNDVDGIFGGLQIGYNFPSESGLVFGLVGDIAISDIDDKNADGPPGPPSVWKTDYSWIATIRGRAGMLVDTSALVYLHGGIAFADIDTKEVGGAGPWAGLSSKHTEVGFVVGAGAEMQVSNEISVFAEYSYMDFGDSTVTPAGPPGSLKFDNDQLHTIKIGINFKLENLF